MGSAIEDFADEDRERAAMRQKGIANRLNRQGVSEWAARDPAFRVTASMGTPSEEGIILGRCGAMVTKVAVGEDSDDFRIGRRALEAALFVAITEDEGAEFLGRLAWGDYFRYSLCIV